MSVRTGTNFSTGSAPSKMPGPLSSLLSVVVAFVLLISVLVILPGGAQAASVIEVDDDADPAWYDATHVHTIEEGIAAALDGDTVLVHPGLYLGTATINKRLNLLSTDGAASTIVRSTGTYGIRIYSDWVNVTGLTSESADYGVHAVSFDHCTVQDCVVRNSDYGIYFHTTQDSKLLRCNVSGCSNYGIFIYNSPGMMVDGNWVNGTGPLDNSYGLFVRASDEAVLERNRVFNNSGYGLRIFENDDLRLENNTMEGNGRIGLSLEVDTATRLRNNTFNGNQHDLYILGNSLATFWQDIDISNQVTSGPIYYYLGASNLTVPSDAGMVGLVQCTNVTVEGLDISHAGQGVVLAHSYGCVLDHLNLDGCYEGIELYYSDLNEILSCTVNGSDQDGLLSRMSTDNLIADCSFINGGEGNLGNGIYGEFSHNTRVERCNVSGNRLHGVAFKDSNYCHVNETLAQNNEHGNGIFAYLSNYFSARGNNVSGNGNGILVSQSSSNCYLSDNIVLNNTQQSSKHGIEVYYSDLAVLINNTVAGNQDGIWIYMSDDAVLRFNTVSGGSYYGGIYVYGALFVMLENNTVMDNIKGIYVNNPGPAFYDYNNSVIANNTLLDSSEEGLRIDGRFKNATIAHNVIEGAGAGYYGISLSDLTRDSLIYDNRIVCPWNAYDAGTNNAWNISRSAGSNIMGGIWLGGNYFSNYSGPDADMDGIGDVPYAIAGPGGSQDMLPLIRETAPPSPPLDLSAAGGVEQVQLDWSPPVDDGGSAVVNYSLYRGASPGSLSLLIKIGNLTSYLDTDVAAGETYFYAVSAHNIAGEGEMSEVRSATVLDVPSAPTLLGLDPDDGQVHVTWQAPADLGGSAITNYTVYRGATAGSLTQLVKLGNVTSYLDTDVTTGQTYYYSVSAHNIAGEGAMSGALSTIVLDVPSAPTLLDLDPGDGQVMLTWQAPADIGGSAITNYTVYRGPTAGSMTQLVKLGNVTSYLDADVINGNEYFYAISASNAIGEGPLCGAVNCTPTWPEHHPSCAITAPAGTYVNSSNVSMSWTMSDEVSGIDFAEVQLDAGDWVFKDDAVSHVFVGVADGAHTLSLRVLNNAGYANSTSLAIIVDTVPPSILNSSWSQAGANGTLTMGFSEAMGSVQGQIDGQPVSFTLLDMNATAVVALAPGVHNLTITGTDLAGNTLSDAAPFQFTVMQASLPISGRVVDDDGNPISGALVDIDGVLATTDSDGWFFCSVSPGEHDITISAEGMQDYIGQLTVDEEGEQGDFTLTPTDDGGGGMDWTLLIVLIVVVLALLILLLLFWRRRRK